MAKLDYMETPECGFILANVWSPLLCF